MSNYPSRVQFFLDRGYQIHSHTPPNYSSCNLIHPDTKIYAKVDDGGSELQYHIPRSLFFVTCGSFGNEHPKFETIFENKLKAVIGRLDCLQFAPIDYMEVSEETLEHRPCKPDYHQFIDRLILGAKFCPMCGEKIR